MQLMILPDGNARCVYNEAIELRRLGSIRVERGSHVEPNEDGQWTADLSPVDGPVLGPFANRTEALQAEVAWLHEHWLNPAAG